VLDSNRATTVSFGANGQGRTKEEARESLAAAIALILTDRREDGLRAVPPDAERETVTVE
jgi:predicted RNase H-like HicB family nuclease